MGDLRIQCERRPHGAVLSLAGAVSIDDGPELEMQITRLIEAKPSVVAVDLTGLTFISSVAIAALVKLHRGLRSVGGRACLVGPSPDVFGALDRARLIEMMPVAPSIEKALTPGPMK